MSTPSPRTCSRCGTQIPQARLDFDPTAEYCVGCQSAIEDGLPESTEHRKCPACGGRLYQRHRYWYCPKGIPGQGGCGYTESMDRAPSRVVIDAYRHSAQRVPNRNTPWSNRDEQEAIRKLLARVPIQEIADSLGRTPLAVRLKLKALGYPPAIWEDDTR